MKIKNNTSLLVILTIKGATINTIGIASPNATAKERGHIFKKLFSKHSASPLHCNYTFIETRANDMIEDETNAMTVLLNMIYEKLICNGT